MPCVISAKKKGGKYWPKTHLLDLMKTLPGQRLPIRPMLDERIEQEPLAHKPDSSFGTALPAEEADNEWSVVAHAIK